MTEIHAKNFFSRAEIRVFRNSKNRGKFASKNSLFSMFSMFSLLIFLSYTKILQNMIPYIKIKLVFE